MVLVQVAASIPVLSRKGSCKELWDGNRGLEGAIARYGADDAFPISDG